MIKSAQVRGMLLEEALLYLLRNSGYRTITGVGNDPTLQSGPAGLEVKGRGTDHQIDAIADFLVSPPFSYPQRLLVEAKCYAQNRRVGVDVIRNAVGVRKDIEEYWASEPRNNRISLKQRYHYQYGIFSASGYTKGAISYAFAHDIYLLVLENSRFIRPIIESIYQFTDAVVGTIGSIPMSLQEIRLAIRNALLQRDQHNWRRQIGFDDLGTDQNISQLIAEYVEICRQVNEAALAMLGNRFPVFLVPAPDIDLNNLRGYRQVRIYWDNFGWYIRSSRNDEDLFSFDLPDELFHLYDESGRLTASQALDLKERYLSEIQLFVTTNDRLHLVTLSLDRDWINQIRNRIGYQSQDSNEFDF